VGKNRLVPAAYRLDGNTVVLALGDYGPAYPLAVDPRVAVGPGVLPESARVAQAKAKYKASRHGVKSFVVDMAHSVAQRSCAPWRTQDERGPPKAIIVANFLLLLETWRPNSFRKKWRRSLRGYSRGIRAAIFRQQANPAYQGGNIAIFHFSFQNTTS
jgi:hypothetical protein